MTRADAKKIVADWWAKFTPGEHRQAFHAALLLQMPDTGEVLVRNDYDPDGVLLEAVRAVGIECRGRMFSGDDIGFPRKTWTRIDDNNVPTLKHGYGANEQVMKDVLTKAAEEGGGK
ncbi:MAG: hypothetical protein IMZ62_12710 [Chloroflexi bacterium]|nr:hypothetical protein [Chloroflexota bacterium]MBE3117520.1 hypothetical protein [Candidatus Atribacteria bacterium]